MKSIKVLSGSLGLVLLFSFAGAGAAEKSVQKKITRSPAQVSPQQTNQIAFEILLKNSAKMTSQDGQTVSSILARVLLTDGATNEKVSNVCNYDKGDALFNCALAILNRDDAGTGGTESSTIIRYQLEKLSNGRPSDNLFYLSVEVERAG